MKKLLMTVGTLAALIAPAMAIEHEVAMPKHLMPETCYYVSDPTGTPLNVRQGPNGKILGALHNGTIVYARGYSGKWTYMFPVSERPPVAFIFGWVLTKYLTECDYECKCR